MSMRRLIRLALSTCALLAPAAVGAEKPETPKTAPGFDIAALDRGVEPCADFYQFACGGWNKANPIPSDESRWGRFNELQERNRATLREILESSRVDDPKRTPMARQIGDYYAACMDEAGAERRGLEPAQPELDAVAALGKKQDLPALVARLQRSGVRAFFGFGAGQDFKDATQNMANLDQGGLGLPDRDYYLKDDAKSAELRDKYREHVKNVFVLAGSAAESAEAQAKGVLEFETSLARISMERVKRRIPENRYNVRSLAELGKLTPSFSWTSYLAESGSPAIERINLVSLPFFEGFEAQVQAASLEQLKTYLRWQVLRATAPLLSARFVNENFDFYGRTLTGAQELRPRYKRCVDAVDANLGEVLGRPYVEKTFGADGKARMRELVDNLERALARDIETLPWMTPVTRKRAVEKLQAITNKIGYPDTWRDYSSVVVKRDDPLGNARRVNEFEWERDMRKIGQPADRKEWVMSPPTVNAYYQPQNNSINFPAGILQPPFFDRTLDDAVNYGSIGAVIGHELSHGFDDQGRKFEGDGNLGDWWSEADAAEFEKRTQCLVDQYADYTAVDDVKLNGRLTLGENVADNGGVRVALLALKDSFSGKPPAPVDGFTPEQRFFLGYAQIWCQNVTPEIARLMAQTNPHSPGRWRVNGVVANSPEFATAFACKAGQPMVRENACRVW